MPVETAASTTAAVASTTLEVPLDTRVKERASGGLALAPTLLRLALVARAQVPGMGPVRNVAFATIVPQELDHAARSSRPFVRSLVVVADESAPEIFMAMQGDHAS